MNKSLISEIAHDAIVLNRSKTLFLSLGLFFGTQGVFAQGVGVNTNSPDPSASLEVAGTNKGLLIPRISLQSQTDKTTIPNPATALLIYNTNTGMGKAGFYYNSGTPGDPIWSLIGVGAATLNFPFSQIGTNDGPLFLINNNDAGSKAIAISGLASSAVGVRGATLSGTGIIGHTASGGKGVTASAANISGTALEVNGRMQIHGPGQAIGAGKVLTSDANGFATWENPGNVAFSASGVNGGGSENIPENTGVTVRFASEDYDLSNNYSGNNGLPHSTFTAPEDGIYHFDVQLGIDGSDELIILRIELIRIRNGINTSMINSIKSNTNPDFDSVALSKDCILKTGDQVSVRVTQQFTNNIKLKMLPSESFFNGRLVVKQ